MAYEEGINMSMPVAPANNGMGFGGDNGWWILLLFLFGMNGGWGNGGNNNMYPWMNQMDAMNAGFQGQALNTQLTGIQGAVTSGFSDVQMAFAQQTAALQAQFAQCCCDNKMATVQTQNIVQAEGAATRLAIQNQTQQILDKLCQQEIDNLKTQNINLQNQVNMLNLAASQTAQTSALVADNAAQTQYLISKLTPTTTAGA